MLRRALIVLAIAGLSCSAALPLWAVAGCPVADTGAHSCCQRHPAPAQGQSGECVLHCSSSVGVLAKVQPAPRPEPATDAHEAVESPLHGLLAATSVLTPLATFDDSSGLYLKVRVLRI